ncbi:hypothetical protein FQN49_002091 [Arthroderma sp. PD_2]|nr:hypothetical protein FQN49_002091 [Arthroderma sp. PD_2]
MSAFVYPQSYRDYTPTSLQALVFRHRAICPLHPEDPPGCNVLTLKGDPCRYKGRNGLEPNETTPGRLPVCGMHRPFAPSSGRCKAVLSCGFECARLFKWSPGEVRLCPDHDDIPLHCYFMSIPAELRVRIYEQLFLEPLPYKGSHSGTRDVKGWRTSIFRVNRMIHDEAASVFYGYPKFTIDVSPDEVFMKGDFWQWGYFKNILREKSELEDSGLSLHRPIALLGAPQHPLLKCTTIQVPMGKTNFSRMRSFHVNINLTHPRKKIPVGSADVSLEKRTKAAFYTLSDNLQKLEALLKLVKPNIRHLSVSIHVSHNFCSELGEVLGYSATALRWLSGLQYVTNARIKTIEWGNERPRIQPPYYPTSMASRPTLVPLWGTQVTDADMPMYQLFKTELSLWKSLVLSGGGTASTSPIMKAYSKLENLLWIFQAAKVRQFREDDNTLPDFLFRARDALHEDDLKAINAISREAVMIWSDHVVEEKHLKSCVWDEFISLEGLSAGRSITPFDDLLNAMAEVGISKSIMPSILD